jgi:hypothetical protein
MFQSYWVALDLPRHLHHYSVKSLDTLADSVKLRRIRMVTPQGNYLEKSVSIVLNDLAPKLGLNWTPIDISAKAGIVWKVIRKGLRLTVEELYSRVACLCGAGPSLQAVFQKTDQPNSVGEIGSSDQLMKVMSYSAGER